MPRAPRSTASPTHTGLAGLGFSPATLDMASFLPFSIPSSLTIPIPKIPTIRLPGVSDLASTFSLSFIFNNSRFSLFETHNHYYVSDGYQDAYGEWHEVNTPALLGGRSKSYVQKFGLFLSSILQYDALLMIIGGILVIVSGIMYYNENAGQIKNTETNILPAGDKSDREQKNIGSKTRALERNSHISEKERGPSKGRLSLLRLRKIKTARDTGRKHAPSSTDNRLSQRQRKSLNARSSGNTPLSEQEHSDSNKTDFMLRIYNLIHLVLTFLKSTISKIRKQGKSLFLKNNEKPPATEPLIEQRKHRIKNIWKKPI